MPSALRGVEAEGELRVLEANGARWSFASPGSSDRIARVLWMQS